MFIRQQAMSLTEPELLDEMISCAFGIHCIPIEMHKTFYENKKDIC